MSKSRKEETKKAIKRGATKIRRAVGVLKKAPPTAVIPFFTVVGAVAGIVFDNLVLWLGISVAVGIVLSYFVSNRK